MKPYDMAVLFDECAERDTGTTLVLDRPFDIAPEGGTRYQVAGLSALVREAAGWLAAAGARPGSRVAIVKANHWDYDLLACAAIRVGAIPAQLSAHLSAEALGTLLKRLEADVLVTDGRVLSKGDDAGVDLASLSRTAISLDGTGSQALSLDDVRGAGAPPVHRRHKDDPLVINHTSGTTGLPKLVVHSTRTIIGKLARFESVRLPVLGVRRDDTLVNASSFAHGRTFCWTASAFCLAPRKIVIVSGQQPDDADPVLRAHPPTIMEATPATFVRFRPLTERLDNPFRNVRLIISTYDAMHPPTIRAYLNASRRRRPLWMQGWGQTETGPLTFRFHTRRSLTEERQRHPDTRNLGRPVPFKTRLRFVDPDTFSTVDRGTPGLVLVGTAARCLDYVGESERWAAKRTGRWWNTGDMAVRGRDGSVRFLDREVDRLPELSCLEIEDVLEDRLPEVIESVLLGSPGAAPLPVLVTSDGRLDMRLWWDAVCDLPPLREPVLLTWDEVPRTGTGKVRRLALADRLTGRTATFGSGRWT
jgi:acyl-coenzyme A synthetase/AMP-(fatty) acid ligase